MKGKWKKSLVCLLCLLFVFGVCGLPALASAEDPSQPAVEEQDEGVDVQGEGVEEQDEGAEPQVQPSEPAVVARMYLCCRVIFFGHTWIYIENLSAQPISVGVIEAAPGEGVSVGTHKYRRADGGGVYYNVEAYMLHQRSSSGVVSRSMDLTSDQLRQVNETIVNNNDWTLSDNCNRFATRVWNSVSPDHVDYKFLPLSEKSEIGSGGGPRMTDPPRDRVLRQRGNGAGASVDRVKDASLLLGIG